jgi:hypothetical protein
MKLSELVAKYIELRDSKATLKAEYEEKLAPVEEKLARIEAALLDVFHKTGMESVKTEAGTAYMSTRTTVSVADRDAFMEFVKTGDHWSMMEIRAAKSAVEQYKAANEDLLPPGVNWRSEIVVNIRRSS